MTFVFALTTNLLSTVFTLECYIKKKKKNSFITG